LAGVVLRLRWRIFRSRSAFKPDVLTNYEIGWKTLWLDHRVQFNGRRSTPEDWKAMSRSGIFEPA